MFDFIVYHCKRDPPVAAHGNAPCAGSVPGQLVNMPARWASHLTHVLRHDQHGQNVAYSLDQVTPDTPGIIVLNETPEPSVSHAADMHIYYRTRIPYTDQTFFQAGEKGHLRTGFARY